MLKYTKPYTFTVNYYYTPHIILDNAVIKNILITESVKPNHAQ